MNNMDDTLRTTLLLQRLPGLGVGRYWRLQEAFGDARRVLEQPLDKLVPVLTAPSLQALRDYRADPNNSRSEEHTSELQSRGHLVCRLLLEKTKITITINNII